MAQGVVVEQVVKVGRRATQCRTGQGAVVVIASCRGLLYLDRDGGTVASGYIAQQIVEAIVSRRRRIDQTETAVGIDGQRATSQSLSRVVPAALWVTVPARSPPLILAIWAAGSPRSSLSAARCSLIQVDVDERCVETIVDGIRSDLADDEDLDGSADAGVAGAVA